MSRISKNQIRRKNPTNHIMMNHRIVCLEFDYNTRTWEAWYKDDSSLICVDTSVKKVLENLV